MIIQALKRRRGARDGGGNAASAPPAPAGVSAEAWQRLQRFRSAS